jgi:hypothetical protein
LGNRSEAWSYLKAGLRWALDKRHFYYLIDALTGIALMLADDGEFERALELYTLVLKHPYATNSRWFEDVVGGEIMELTANLPPQVAEVARKKRDSLDFWGYAAEIIDELPD